ncbi:hypothetical protein BHE74_00003473 [Ensete ventricosum]|nr:hypothetical protein BHE74_00003473 [Ensete ventricosum]RZR82213.1 hypothetical protein BHM03_00008594 [Ensete ventricosum]
MTNGDMTVTSVGPRTIGPSMWLTRRGKLAGRQYGGASDRTVDLTQVRSTPQRSYGRPDTGKVDTLTCGHMPYRKDGGRGGRIRRHGKPQGHARSATTGADRIHWAGTRFGSNILALEGGHMSQERPFGNSGAEHHPELDHPRPTEEAAVAVPTPNRF